MLFSIGHAPLVVMKKKRGRKPKWHFDLLAAPGVTMTVHDAEQAGKAYEAAKSWLRRHPGWTFEYGTDEQGRFVIRRVT